MYIPRISMKKSCLSPQSEQVVIILFKAGAILIRYGGRWSMSWAWSTRRRDSQDQVVVLIVETSKLYRTSEPMSTILGRASFVPRDFCYSRQGLPFNSRLLQRTNWVTEYHLHVVHEHKYYFGLINFVNVLILTNVMKCQIAIVS